MAPVAVIGLGAMGAPIARNLLTGGHQERGGARRDTAADFEILAG